MLDYHTVVVWLAKGGDIRGKHVLRLKLCYLGIPILAVDFNVELSLAHLGVVSSGAQC